MNTIPSNGHPNTSNENFSQAEDRVDIVGGPWAIIESDPGIFTTVMQKLGIRRCEAAEVYSIESDGLSHLEPFNTSSQIHGLIFCSQVQTESQLNMHDLPGDASGSEDVDFKEIWFANQLIHNACATQAILNVIFNCPQLDIGAKLRNFKDFTRNMGPKMKGLALSNDLGIRDIHNTMARPADLQDALHGLAKRTALTDSEKKRAAERAKRKNKPATKKKKKADEDEDEDDDSDGDTVYHYVGYVPFKGKVWELDGLRMGPLEVGEIPSASRGNDDCSREWLEVVRPAIRIKIESLQGSGHDIRFNLLALVEGGWEKRSDEFELLRREKRALERRLDNLDPAWKTKLADSTLYSTAEATFSARTDPGAFNPSFGFLSSERGKRVLELPEDQILQEWLRCCREAQSVTTLLREEQEKAQTWATEDSKRTHNFEQFFQAFAEALHEEGHLLPTLGLSDPTSVEANPSNTQKE
ncbi:hypothetical protein M407DRAFT_14084 [Tulasnella calospora MUT 4182]|uniref:ubiquitinyl hydrolase 1 n=1 Tax=Tulasnella calospora MUT 4182 TaxID=1051891 RepID=A0A0C3QTH4_9AGAM|nr:hypothetical protein M407DRAFT_14084 [Tulasnella calospora MUT 4182]